MVGVAVAPHGGTRFVWIKGGKYKNDGIQKSGLPHRLGIGGIFRGRAVIKYHIECYYDERISYLCENSIRKPFTIY